MIDSIGRLILDSELRASAKKSKEHTSFADCGCYVTTSWFSPRSRTNKISHCAQHKPSKQ